MTQLRYIISSHDADEHMSAVISSLVSMLFPFKPMRILIDSHVDRPADFTAKLH